MTVNQNMNTTDAFDPYTYPGCPNANVHEAYVVIVVSVGFFTSINYVIQASERVTSRNTDTWRQRNTLVSWIHAVVVGLGCLFSLHFKPEIFEGDNLLVYCDNFTYWLVALSLGYFVYDFLDICLSGKIHASREVLAHHVGVVVIFWYNVYYRVMIPYTIIALMTEINSILLHARKLLHFYRWPLDHWLYRSVVVLNLYTFLRYRMVAVCLITADLNGLWDKLTSFFRTYLTLTMICMLVINTVLLWRLVKNDVLRQLNGRKSRDTDASNGGTAMESNIDVSRSAKEHGS